MTFTFQITSNHLPLAPCLPFLFPRDHEANPQKKKKKRIPYKQTLTGNQIQDWDSVEAFNIPLLTRTLSHLRATGSLPDGLRSIQDLNEKTESGVSSQTITALRGYVSSRLAFTGGGGGGGDDDAGGKTLALLEGILLFSPAQDKEHTLQPMQEIFDARLFLPAAYEDVKRRREARSGYVTAGAEHEHEHEHEPPLPQRSSSADDTAGTGAGSATGPKAEAEAEAEAEGTSSFWVDPPGYVDDVVWPNYALSHSWLLLPTGTEGKDSAQVVREVGVGTTVRRDVGVSVPPGRDPGRLSMEELLRWAVDEVLKCWSNQ